MTTITIDDTGHLEIPQDIREQLGINTPQPLNLEVRNGCIVLKPLRTELSLHRDGTALILETPALGSLDTLIDDLREERIVDQTHL